MHSQQRKKAKKNRREYRLFDIFRNSAEDSLDFRLYWNWRVKEIPMCEKRFFFIIFIYVQQVKIEKKKEKNKCLSNWKPFRFIYLFDLHNFHVGCIFSMLQLFFHSFICRTVSHFRSHVKWHAVVFVVAFSLSGKMFWRQMDRRTDTHYIERVRTRAKEMKRDKKPEPNVRHFFDLSLKS